MCLAFVRRSSAVRIGASLPAFAELSESLLGRWIDEAA